MAGAAALRDYRESDADALNRVALAAFEQFRGDYDDWPAMARAVSGMSGLSGLGEIVVADDGARVVGGVAYMPPGAAKAAYFDRSWPVIRMLVVDPAARGRGIGRALTEECIRRARRDGSRVIALHTTAIMTVALPMYLRLGFKLSHDAPSIHGVPYAVYTMTLPET